MASWLTVSQSTGPLGQTQIEINALKNESSSQRKATLVFRAGNAVHKVEVIQKNSPQPTIDSLPLSLSTSLLKFNDSVAITGKSENYSSISQDIETSVKDKSQYIITNISEDDSAYTISYKKSKIESNDELDIKTINEFKIEKL